MASSVPKSIEDAPDSTAPSPSSPHPFDYALPSCSAVPMSADDAETARLVAKVLDKAEVGKHFTDKTKKHGTSYALDVLNHRGAPFLPFRPPLSLLAHPPPLAAPSPTRNQPQVDLRELRKLAVVKGLGTNALRARAWPLLLGARAGADDLDVLQRLSASCSSSSLSDERIPLPSPPPPPLHRDSAVVDVDVERSLWAFTRGWSEGARASARDALRRVINASVAEASRELQGKEAAAAAAAEEDSSGTAAERRGDGASAAANLRRRRRGEASSSSSSHKEEAESKGDGERSGDGGESGNAGGSNGALSSPPPPPSSSSSPSPSSSTVHYYQGLHDVASVLLLVTGSEVAAFRLLRRLAACQLRDFTRPTLDVALEACDLLPLIVARVDPQLGRALDSSRNPGAPPSHYALSWLLTWFAHSAGSSSSSRRGDGTGATAAADALAAAAASTAAAAAASNDDTLNSAARLFDLFAASHPFMPLYVAAAAIVADRRRLLDALAEGDPAEAHAALARVCVFGVGERRVAELAAEAHRLCRRHPPGELAREARRRSRAAASARSSTAALARLGADGSWVVEDRIGGAGGGKGEGEGEGGKASGGPLSLLRQQLRSQQKARGVAAVALAAGVAALALFAGGPASIGAGGGGGRG